MQVWKYLKQNFLSLVLVALFVCLPFVSLAANEVSNGLNTSRYSSLFPNSGIGGSRTLSELIYNAVRIMLVFAGAIAVLFVVIGGYWYITAQGNEEQAEKGKNTLLNAIMGVVIIILSYAIIYAVVNLVSTGTGLFG